MTDDHEHVGGTTDEQRLRARLRFISGMVIAGCIVGMVFVPSLRASDITTGMFLGALLLLGGVEGAAAFWPWRNGK